MLMGGSHLESLQYLKEPVRLNGITGDWKIENICLFGRSMKIYFSLVYCLSVINLINLMAFSFSISVPSEYSIKLRLKMCKEITVL